GILEMYEGLFVQVLPGERDAEVRQRIDVFGIVVDCFFVGLLSTGVILHGQGCVPKHDVGSLDEVGVFYALVKLFGGIFDSAKLCQAIGAPGMGLGVVGVDNLCGLKVGQCGFNQISSYICVAKRVPSSLVLWVG